MYDGLLAVSLCPFQTRRGGGGGVVWNGRQCGGQCGAQAAPNPIPTHWRHAYATRWQHTLPQNVLLLSKQNAIDMSHSVTRVVVVGVVWNVGGKCLTRLFSLGYVVTRYFCGITLSTCFARRVKSVPPRSTRTCTYTLVYIMLHTCNPIRGA